MIDILLEILKTSGFVIGIMAVLSIWVVRRAQGQKDALKRREELIEKRDYCNKMTSDNLHARAVEILKREQEIEAREKYLGLQSAYRGAGRRHVSTPPDNETDDYGWPDTGVHGWHTDGEQATIIELPEVSSRIDARKRIDEVLAAEVDVRFPPEEEYPPGSVEEVTEL